MTTVILHGKSEDKTKLTNALKRIYGPKKVIEDWKPYDGMTTDALHITDNDSYQLHHLYCCLDQNLLLPHIYSEEMVSAIIGAENAK